MHSVVLGCSSVGKKCGSVDVSMKGIEEDWRLRTRRVCFSREIESCLQRRRSCLSRPKATASSLFVCVLADRLLLLSEGKLCFSVCDRSVFTDKLESEISWSS